MADLYEDLRPKAFGVAYRLMGSVGEAEDLVQEGMLRLHRELDAGTQIESPEAFLVTVVTRLGIDELRSARARRETYVGEWLPEPIVTDSAEDPARHAEIADSLSVGLLVVLETLTPEQRAVFLLREVFDYDYERIAEIVDKSPAAVRQLAARARHHIEERKPRFETSREQRDRLAERFFDAVEAGNVGALEELLAAEATFHGDGGGKAPAIARALQGRARVAKALAAFRDIGERWGGFELRRVEVNGGPGVVATTTDGRVISAMSLEIGDGSVQRVNSVVNPDKLRHLGEPADLGALIARARQNRPGSRTGGE